MSGVVGHAPPGQEPTHPRSHDGVSIPTLDLSRFPVSNQTVEVCQQHSARRPALNTNTLVFSDCRKWEIRGQRDGEIALEVQRLRVHEWPDVSQPINALAFSSQPLYLKLSLIHAAPSAPQYLGVQCRSTITPVTVP